ncbi:hypothetical protein GCM10009645_54030 [Mycolicibacterium poriferae]|uniref:Uncharacterized protein n=1 Tax=Mycolicibacterium poriferae TaxID=39694 RepID=A0A6N4VHR8_9MYCO|nr:hypothetical protein [Mycolicibacterium poriferae]MCV7262652.1 hypothetical protein [Mycolicibacterium poriferae]BBX53147.1 hypothetical protein MPOR_41730 [Mycolicibacterium poriferae]
MKPESKTEAIVLCVISAIAMVLIVLQLAHNNWSVDLWVVVLFGVGALPWFYRVLESVDFPGGGGLKLREVKQEQARQAEEIQALQFLTANFLRDEQKQVLRKFGEDGPVRLEDGEDGEKLITAANALIKAGLIGKRPAADTDEGQEKSHRENDLKIVAEITEAGRDYLALLERLPTK